MQIIRDGRATLAHAVLALGMFDGVHIGHRVLLEKAHALAREREVPLVVCTFLNHPMALIAPTKCPPCLTTFEERAKLMEALGVDLLYAMPFDHRLMEMLPENYVGELVRRFHPTDVVCGYNHSFGRKGQGSPALLAALGGALGFATYVVPKITLGGRNVSSTAIRALLADGDAAQAREMLARPYVRGAAVVTRGADAWEFMLRNDGKQNVADGLYRALASWAGRTVPLTLRMRGALGGSCGAIGAIAPHEEIEIQYLTRKPER
ncbi:MAG: FAD synthetase family protein [Clostridia bacterium]